MDDFAWVLTIGGLCLLSGAILHWVAWRGYTRAAWALCALLTLLGGGLLLAARNAQGWDGLGYAVVAMVFVAPALVGAVLGTLSGWIRRRRRPSRVPGTPLDGRELR
ncbi:MAG: hypothetical protein KF901_06740 [Myxococcales bacterium]|nr:hypothetical protein [Myxococcales bacterium]